MYKYYDIFISEVKRCIVLTLVKRSTGRYNASFTARSWNVSITYDYKRGKNINLKIKKNMTFNFNQFRNHI